MTHEPTTPPGDDLPALSYNQHQRLEWMLRKAFRDGYNQHAYTVQHWQDTHGAYRQHGEGEGS